MDDLTYKIIEEATETEDNFIFTTINPWCEDVMQRKISKRDLERALALYFDGGSVLDKIRAEIVDLGQRTMNDNRVSGIWACRDIIDKYRANSEDE